ncbi:Small GTP-binding protein domain-containing protein [Candidatus Nitrotoga sp. M5]|nr:Small GTP-binding protein domain-containing protein [Candidatus Nitrotoga sp. M5]
MVRAVAGRLRADGLRVWFDEWEIKPGDSIPAKIEAGLEQSRILLLCMSTHAFSSDWATLESQTFRFRDPLNKERRFIPLRLDNAHPKGSLSQFFYINWLPDVRAQEYATLLETCRPPAKRFISEVLDTRERVAEKSILLDYEDARIYSYAFSLDGKRAITGSADNTIRIWNLETGRCLDLFGSNDWNDWIESVAWSTDQRRILSGGGNKALTLWDIKMRCRGFLEGHTRPIWSMAWSIDQRRALTGSCDKTVRLWDVEAESCLNVLCGHTDAVGSVALSADQRFALSGSDDNTIRMWDLETGSCLRVFEGHTLAIKSVVWSSDHRYALSGSHDKTIRLWDVESGRCLQILEGHSSWIGCVVWCADQRYALSGSDDSTIRLWDVDVGRCLCVYEGHITEVCNIALSADQRHALSGDVRGEIREWDLSEFIAVARSSEIPAPALKPIPNQIQYTNAKVLLVGDTSSGKTALTHRLATGGWKPSDESTVGAWCTQWILPEVVIEGVEREIWLWDFGGQADQRLVHQLYMDNTALILLLFDADKEDVLPGLRDWQTALRRCVPAVIPLLLVAGRIDVGFRASRSKLQAFAQEQGFRYFESSAKDGTGCRELSQAIKDGIPWEQMEHRTSPLIFKLIKDEILKLGDEGQVLHTYKELRELLWQRLTDEPRFDDATLKTVIGLLDGPGAVQELDYGSFILLQPEWISAYAQAVIRTLRQEPSELGCLPLRSIAEGKLLFQTVERNGEIVEMKRLPKSDERIILQEMERQLEERGLCLRQGDKLVFPSYCGRERPALRDHPAVFVSYAVQGYLDDIYASLVVKLAESHSFKLKELWRDAADFLTLSGDHHMGIKLRRDGGGNGEVSIYFAPGVTPQEQVIFANYIHAHLEPPRCEGVQRLRHYVCPYCHSPKGNSQALMQKLMSKKEQATVMCDTCDESFSLWDGLEKLFANNEVHKQVEGLQGMDSNRLDSRRKGKLLALEVGSRITSADQKCFEIPSTEDEGIDMELEFTDDVGHGTGQRLYLQLKSGNSHLEKRKNGSEIFKIKKQRWVEYWLKQPQPVMLVIGTFTEDERYVGKEKLEFAEVRWMEISSYLKRESEKSEKPVTQIEFNGERLDMSSVQRWRRKMLNPANE